MYDVVQFVGFWYINTYFIVSLQRKKPEIAFLSHRTIYALQLSNMKWLPQLKKNPVGAYSNIDSGCRYTKVTGSQDDY